MTVGFLGSKAAFTVICSVCLSSYKPADSNAVNLFWHFKLQKVPGIERDKCNN